MSVTSISSKNKNLLWAVSAGRCEYIGCNKVLHTDILTNKKCNSAYIAHIVGDEPTGPRGDIKRSKLLANDINNLMLLCDTHHRMVDEDEITYTEPCLLEMKRQHEERIRRITDIAPNMSSEIILYGANIGINNSPLSYQSACEALLYDYYPASDNAIELRMKNVPFTDDTDTYWMMEEALPKGYNRLLIVFACLIIVYTVHEYPEKVNTFFFTLLVEIITYIATIWIYRGFKELP